MMPDGRRLSQSPRVRNQSLPMRAWDDDSDPELPAVWEDDDSDTLTVACPKCGMDVYEDAEQCPLCGEWMTRSLRGWEGKPAWWIVLGLLGIGAVLWLLIPGL
jgi:hypothetical protein